MIENWIDEVAKTAGNVASLTGGQVKSYRVFGKNEVPEALSVFPCAISYVTAMHPAYSDSLSAAIYEGRTEFHLFPNTAKANLAGLQVYIGRILNAFAARRQLGGLVAHFLIVPEMGLELSTLQYGSEEEHHGILVHWEVKEILNGMTLGL
jgi:hypothetical protein